MTTFTRPASFHLQVINHRITEPSCHPDSIAYNGKTYRDLFRHGYGDDEDED
jgi:hypothetical protein